MKKLETCKEKFLFIDQINKKILWEYLFIFLLLFFTLFISVFFLDNEIPTWVNIISILSAISGILSVIQLARKKISNFFWGFINIFTYSIVAFYSSIYGDFILYILIYLPFYLYGYRYWKKGDSDNFELSKFNSKNLLIMVLIWILVFTGLGLILFFLTNDTLPWIDSLTTSLSIVAIYLQIFKYKESYVLWFLVNIISIILWSVLYSNGESYILPIILSYISYLLVNFWGFKSWYFSKKKSIYIGYSKIIGYDNGTKAIYSKK